MRVMALQSGKWVCVQIHLLHHLVFCCSQKLLTNTKRLRWSSPPLCSSCHWAAVNCPHRCMDWWWRPVYLRGPEPVWIHTCCSSSDHHWPGSVTSQKGLAIVPVASGFSDNFLSEYLPVIFNLVQSDPVFVPWSTEPPVLARGASSLTTVIGQSLTIPCMLMDGIPLPERYWQHNGKQVRLIFHTSCQQLPSVTSPWFVTFNPTSCQVQLSTRTFLKSDGSLHIDRVIPEDAGTYVCTAINVMGSANLSVTLDVHGKVGRNGLYSLIDLSESPLGRLTEQSTWTFLRLPTSFPLTGKHPGLFSSIHGQLALLCWLILTRNILLATDEGWSRCH